MAKIKFGMMMTDARGKLGGQVFSKNRSGAYIRTKVTPVNPQTSFQQLNRSALGNLSSAWSGLSQESRLAWNGSVESWQSTNIFGDSVKPTGKNLFTGLNKVMLEYYPGRTIMSVPPAKIVFQSFSVLSGSLVASTGVATVTLAGVNANLQAYRVRATGQLSAGTTYIKNQLRGLSGVFTPTESNVITFTSAYANRFGIAVVGSVVGVEITPIFTNGQLGVPSTYLIVVS